MSAHHRAPRPRRVQPGTVLRVALVALLFTAAPTVGDIGSCGQSPDDLDPVKYFTAKETLDCERCRACDILTDACTRACEPALDLSDFPSGCYPLVHDGEVCLRVLSASSCQEYAGFMADVAPTLPTECNFCPPCDDGGLPDGSPVLAPCE